MEKWPGLRSDHGRILLKEVSWNCRTEDFICRRTARFVYLNDSPRAAKTTFEFAISHDAALTNFSMTDARGVRTSAVRLQKPEPDTDCGEFRVLCEYASRLMMHDNGICTAETGLLLPGEELTLELGLIEALKITDGTARITIPGLSSEPYSVGMTHEEGHMRLDAGKDTERAPRLTIRFSFDGPMFRRARSQIRGCIPKAVAVGEGADMTIRSGITDRTIVATLTGLEPEPSILSVKDGNSFRQIAFIPMPASVKSERRPLSVKLLLDCSRSMEGHAEDNLRSAMEGLAELLTPADRLAYARFGQACETIVPALTPVTEEFIRKTFLPCLKWLGSYMGSTNVENAVLKAIELSPEEKADILLVTTRPSRRFSDEFLQAVSSSGHRIFIVGIGRENELTDLAMLALLSQGAFEAVLSTGDLFAALGRMLDRMRTDMVAVDGLSDLISGSEHKFAFFAGEVLTLTAEALKNSAPEKVLRLRNPDDSATLKTLRTRVCSDPDLLKLSVRLSHKDSVDEFCYPTQNTADVETRREFAAFIRDAERIGLFSPHTSQVLLTDRERRILKRAVSRMHSSEATMTDDNKLPMPELYPALPYCGVLIPKYLRRDPVCRPACLAGEDDDASPLTLNELMLRAKTVCGITLTKAIERFSEEADLLQEESFLVCLAVHQFPGRFEKTAQLCFSALRSDLQQRAREVFTDFDLQKLGRRAV